MNGHTEMQGELFKLTLLLLTCTMMVEAAVLFGMYDHSVPEILVGRILGWFEVGSATSLAYWFTSSHSSAVKNGLVSKVAGDRNRASTP